MANDPLEEFCRRVERERDSAPLDYPEALIRLIDAIRDYLRSDKMIADELLFDDAITREQYDKGMAQNEPLVTWLKAHEEHGIDPSLHGTIKEKR